MVETLGKLREPNIPYVENVINDGLDNRATTPVHARVFVFQGSKCRDLRRRLAQDHDSQRENPACSLAEDPT